MTAVNVVSTVFDDAFAANMFDISLRKMVSQIL